MNTYKKFSAVCGGSLLEWYDFSIYSLLAPVIATVFFPSDSYTRSLMLTYCVWAVSFIVRPVAGLIMGRVGDKYGRKKVMLLSAIIMCFCTSLIGILPGYDLIGSNAIIILVFSRLLQGVAISTESTGAMVYQIERLSVSKNVSGAIVHSASFAGILCATFIVILVNLLLSQANLVKYGWRIPFLLGAIAGIVLIIVRLKLPESAAFIASKKDNTKRTRHSGDWQLLLCSFFIPAAATAGIYFFTYQIAYINHFPNINLAGANMVNAVSMLIIVICIPFSAKLADYYGIKKILILGLLLQIVTAFPVFWMMARHSFFVVFTGQLLFSLSIIPYLGLNTVFMASLYRITIRVTAFSFIYNLSVAIFGGTIPVIAINLKNMENSVWSFPCYYILLCFISFVAIILSFTLGEQRQDKLLNSGEVA